VGTFTLEFKKFRSHTGVHELQLLEISIDCCVAGPTAAKASSVMLSTDVGSCTQFCLTLFVEFFLLNWLSAGTSTEDFVKYCVISEKQEVDIQYQITH